MHTLDHHCQQRQLGHDGTTLRALVVKRGGANKARIVRGHIRDQGYFYQGQVVRFHMCLQWTSHTNFSYLCTEL